MTCNRIAWLKFMMPNICNDRIFLMKITGQESITVISDYLKLQKKLGNLIIGDYSLLLERKEQTNFMGKTFNNCILNIVKKEDFNSNNTNPKNSPLNNAEKQENLKTTTSITTKTKTDNVEPVKAEKGTAKTRKNTEKKVKKTVNNTAKK